ncbi:hypothetical protein VTK73DRAFT_6872 [Phialemonium thermophilum]|uniref:Erythromycin biosynthesis protein CIII-like C-terminal domain-containing protein n=1 Tax=Phialemonium thermophilum TaxID=223376 RepID=A0ABR3XVR4_9PEZI
MSRPKRVLILTNSEHGQANVCLATSYALLTVDEEVEVHFASFAAIEDDVQEIAEFASEHNTKSGRRIIFHKINGLDMQSAWSRPEVYLDKELLKRRKSFGDAWRQMRILLQVMFPWSGPEYVEIFESVVDIIEDVNPDIIAVDPILSQALTACRHLGRKFVVLSPNTIKEFSIAAQPWGEALWRYPCVGCAFPFPMPLYYVPFNILLVFFIIIATLLDPHRRQIRRYFHAHARGTPQQLITLNDLAVGRGAAAKILVANLPGLEFPLRYIPEYIIPCGPMLRPARPIEQADPGLAGWFRRSTNGKSNGGDISPVIYINLGTHFRMEEEVAVEMATALRIVLDLARSRHEGGTEIKSGNVRIVDWIEPEPAVILAEESIVCAVHHGGANSFLEAARAGVPQVVLPIWTDTFDFARRVELLGIGRWGIRYARSSGWGTGLGNVLVDVLLSENAESYKTRSKELALQCNRNGGGRVVAARAILAEIEDDNDQKHLQNEESGAELETDRLI